LLIAVPAILALAGAGALGASGPTTLLQCAHDLSICQVNLSACGTDLSLAQADLATCNSDLSQAQSGLAACEADYLEVKPPLSFCRADVQQLQSDLAACNAALTACEALGFPASGQTTAFSADRNDGLPGAVAVPDDGTVEAGATLSYTDNGDGTITDLRTGLMWEKKSDDGGLHDKDNSYYWSGNGDQETIWDWLADVNAEGFAGYHDWRLPNVRELLSLVNFQFTPLAISAAFNNNCVPGATVLTGSCTFIHNYWSSSTAAESPSAAWYVSFNHGTVSRDSKSFNFRVRAVRGGSL
jgi:hypothetical protein